MNTQLCLFDFADCVTEKPLGEWEFADLREWADSFGLPWKEDTYAGNRSLRCEKSKREIVISLGRVWDFGLDEYVPAIHFNHWDSKRQGGGGAAYSSVDKCRERVEERMEVFGWKKDSR